MDWSNLTDEQKAKLLEEQALLSAHHQNPGKDILDDTDMSREEKAAYLKKIEEEAKAAYDNAMKEMEKREKQKQEEYDKMINE